MPPLDPETFRTLTGVPRETLARLRAYEAELRRWQPRINLVGPSTLPDLWRRHMLDSAQLHPLLPESTRVLLDLGSGAGFPGLVLAILGVPEVHLVESDARKAAFLREAARASGTAVTVHARRIEAMPPFPVDAVTARALAPLTDLLAWCHPFVGSRGVALYPKGQNVEGEIGNAARSWVFAAERLPSRSDPSGTILRVRGIDHA